MAAYEIRLSGCDDTTVFVVDLTDAEAAVADRVAARSRQAAEYGCQPRMTIAPAPASPNEVPE
jgi:hypothetical protein